MDSVILLNFAALISGCVMSSCPTSLTMTLVFVPSRVCWSVLETSKETRSKRQRNQTLPVRKPLLNAYLNKRYVKIEILIT